MSLESIALIGILTLFTVILGTELATLLIGHSPLEAINSERLSAIAQGHRSIGYWLASGADFFASACRRCSNKPCPCDSHRKISFENWVR